MNSNRKKAQEVGKIVAKELKRCGFSGHDSLYKVENSAREFLQQVGQACIAEFLKEADNELHEEMKKAVSEKDFYYHSYRPAVILSAFGKVRFERRYYRYKNAKERDEKGFAYLD